MFVFANTTVTNVFYCLQEVVELCHVGSKEVHEFDTLVAAQTILLFGSVGHFTWSFAHWLRSVPHRLRGFWQDTDGAVTIPADLPQPAETPRPTAKPADPRNVRKKSKRRKARGRR